MPPVVENVPDVGELCLPLFYGSCDDILFPPPPMSALYSMVVYIGCRCIGCLLHIPWELMMEGHHGGCLGRVVWKTDAQIGGGAN